LIEAMGCQGFDASIQPPRDGEYSEGGIVIDNLVGVSVFLWEHIRDDTLAALVGVIVNYLILNRSSSSQSDTPVVGRIYGPDGEVLREFEIPVTGGPVQRRSRLEGLLRWLSRS
jgi:hypothetical protein